jgi:hypothetical protein
MCRGRDIFVVCGGLRSTQYVGPTFGPQKCHRLSKVISRRSRCI